MMFLANCRQGLPGAIDTAVAVKIEALTAREAARKVCGDKRWASCSIARPGVYGARGLYRLEVYTAKGRHLRTENA